MSKFRNEMLSMLMSPLFAQCLSAAAKLKIADHLKDEKKSVSKLAEITNTNEAALYRMLNLLASYGVFEEQENKFFKINKLGETLVSDNPDSLYPVATYLGEENCYFRAFEELLYSIKTGKSAFEKAFELPFFEYLKNNKNSHEKFNQFMAGKFTPVFKSVINNYDFSQFSTIVDIGGGNGNFIIEILKKNKCTNGIIFDLPELMGTATQHIIKESLKKRCKFVGGSFFETIPQKADAYMMKSIIHDWSDEDAVKILQNCSKSMPKDSKLLVVEQIISPDKLNDSTKLSDMLMLVLFASKERTEENFKLLFDKVGLEITNVFKTDTEFSIIETVKK